MTASDKGNTGELQHLSLEDRSACALTVFAEMIKKTGERGELPKTPVIFIGTVDEEDFMRGAEAVIRDGWVSRDDFILDTEPTDGQIQAAHKGRIWFELMIKGITAHASNPWKGADAIAAMAEAISYIRKEMEKFPVHEDMGRGTVTFGQITGGSFNGYTDTAVIAGILGACNCMSYGPGSLELAHKPNEYVSWEDVCRCRQVLSRLAGKRWG